jgi:hypothetical protein
MPGHAAASGQGWAGPQWSASAATKVTRVSAEGHPQVSPAKGRHGPRGELLPSLVPMASRCYQRAG